MRTRPSSVVCLATLMLTGQFAAAQAKEAPLALNIPAQSLPSALNALAEQTGLQIVYETDIALGYSSQAVKGKLTAQEALKRLLRGTGLNSQYLNDHAIAISSASEPRFSDIVHTEAKSPLIHLAQVSGEAAARIEPNAKQTSLPTPRAPQMEVEEIVVTGSHIRGVRNTGSPVTVITRNDMDRTGYTTVQDMLKTFTPNTGGGPSEESENGLEQQSNFNAGGSVNLRGLGASSTLVLINGRRQASGGVQGRFTDISSIPATAIDRIEILTDGASAIYGSDAVGGVVNIILRNDFEGAETRLRVGTAKDGADELVVGQLLGGTWDGGNAMFAYQYWNRDALSSDDRKFSKNLDKGDLGGDDLSLPYNNPGNIRDPSTGALIGIPHGQDGRSLTPSDLLPGVVNSGDLFSGVDLIPRQTMHSAFVAVSQRINDHLQLHADGRFSQRKMLKYGTSPIGVLNVPSSNPFFVDPFGGSSSVRVYYSFFDDLGPVPAAGETQTYTGTIGGTLDLGGDWRVELTGSYGHERLHYLADGLTSSPELNAALADPNPATAFNPFGDGSYTNPATLDLIRKQQFEHAVSNIWTSTVIAQGPLFYIPGGSVRAAIGADHRDERFERWHATRSRSEYVLKNPGQLDRRESSVFAEIQVPLVGLGNRRRGIEDLRLSLAGRYEEYSDFGTTFNPKLGLSWTPVESVDIRASAGTSFKAPNLNDLDEGSVLNPSDASLLAVPDPQSPVGQTRILVLSGNNSDLHEETATTWTAGIDIHPLSIPELGLSLTYFDIDYEDRIERGGPGTVFDIFRAEDQWAPIITRNPSRAAVEKICSQPGLSFSLQDCLAGPLPAIVDARVRNLGTVQVRGIDGKLRYLLKTGLGEWAFRLDGSYLLSFDQATTKTSPPFDLIDTLSGPLSLRLRAGASWVYRAFGADLAINYQNSYTDHLSEPHRNVDSLTTLDLRFTYQLTDMGAWLDDTKLAFGVVNLFDRNPPFVNNFFGYDKANADPIGRIFSLQLTKTW